MTKDYTSIRVTEKTHKKLNQLKLVPSETMDGVIDRLLKDKG